MSNILHQFHRLSNNKCLNLPEENEICIPRLDCSHFCFWITMISSNIWNPSSNVSEFRRFWFYFLCHFCVHENTVIRFDCDWFYSTLYMKYHDFHRQLVNSEKLPLIDETGPVLWVMDIVRVKETTQSKRAFHVSWSQSPFFIRSFSITASPK